MRVWLLGTHLSWHSCLPGKSVTVASREPLSATFKKTSPTEWIRKPAGRSTWRPRRQAIYMTVGKGTGPRSEHLRTHSGIRVKSELAVHKPALFDLPNFVIIIFFIFSGKFHMKNWPLQESPEIWQYQCQCLMQHLEPSPSLGVPCPD